MDRRRIIGRVAVGMLAGTAGVRLAAAQSAAPEGPGVALLRRLAAAVTAHDLARIDTIYAAGTSYVNHQALVAAPSDIPPREAFKAYLQQRIAAFPDLALSIEVAMESGDMIAGNLIWSGTQQGAYLGVPPRGRHVVWNSTDIFRTRDGLICDHWGAVDLFGLLRQLQA